MRTYLVKARLEKGFSQRKTAREARLSFQHFSKIENGDRGRRISFMTMCSIANALDILLDDLYDMESTYQDELDCDDDQDY